MTFDKCSYLARASGELSTSPVPLTLDGPVTITFPATEQWILETLEHLRTPENPPLPSRETTVFHTPPSHPPIQMPPPHVCPVCVQRDPGTQPHLSLPGSSFSPCLPSPQCLHQNLQPNPHYYGDDNAMQNPCTGHLTHAALLAAAAEYHDPATFQKAIDLDFADEWHDTCQYEMDALAKNGTWDLVDLPVG
jgi:hypothetical protein